MGEVAFEATLRSGRVGILTGPDAADEVLATGDLLFDSRVISLSFLRGGLNDGGEIAFFARFADGNRGIFRATPVPEPATLFLLAMAALASCFCTPCGKLYLSLAHTAAGTTRRLCRSAR